jgi:putative DNA primase/helicase
MSDAAVVAKLRAIGSPEEATAWVTDRMLEHAQGDGPDLESGCLRLARRWRLPEEPVRDGWERARKQRKTADFFRNLALQPEDMEAEERWRAEQAAAERETQAAAKTPALVVVDGAPLVRRRREWWKEGREHASQLSSSVSQLSSVPLASPELKPELVREVGKLVQLRVMEQTKAEPEFEEQARPKLPPFARYAPIEEASGDVELSAGAPYDVAREFVRRTCWREGWLATYWWHDGFWRWNGQVYREMAIGDMRTEVYEFLDGAWKKTKTSDGDWTRARFRPTPKDVNAVVDGLKAGLALDADCYPPAWLDRGERADGVLMFKNGLVAIATGEMVTVTPKLWVQEAMGYDWDEEAKCPRWERFLEEVFHDDKESRDFVEEWLGLGMTTDIRFEKAVMMIGEKPRGGRGTIMGVQKGLTGAGQYIGLSTHNWLKDDKSMEPLIGKKVGCFPDVRLRPPKWYGNHFDPGGLDHNSVEWLLKIIAGDTVSIPRKYQGNWNGVLLMKVTMLSNEVPNLNDPVLPTRYIKLAFDESWLGREDVKLKDTLASELPGIAQRCLRAYRRLCERGKFVQPASGATLQKIVEEGSDPFLEFVRSTFVADPQGSVVIRIAFDRFKRWCAEEGRMELLKRITKQNYKKHIQQVPGFEGIDLGPRPHGAARSWIGLRLRNALDDEDDDN